MDTTRARYSLRQSSRELSSSSAQSESRINRPSAPRVKAKRVRALLSRDLTNSKCRNLCMLPPLLLFVPGGGCRHRHRYASRYVLPQMRPDLFGAEVMNTLKLKVTQRSIGTDRTNINELMCKCVCVCLDLKCVRESLQYLAWTLCTHANREAGRQNPP